MALRLLTTAILFFLISANQTYAQSNDLHGFKNSVEQSNKRKAEIHSVGQHRTTRTVRHYRHSHRSKIARASVSLKGVTPILAAKANEIRESCGSVIVSAVAGRSNKSNHPRGRAVDLRGNPACIYAHLKGWPGGYSTDYATAPGGPHVHVSYNPGGQEWGLHFTHRHGKVRLAHKRHRIAQAM